MMMDIQLRLERLVDWGWCPRLQTHLLIAQEDAWQHIQFTDYVGDRVLAVRDQSIGWTCDAVAEGERAVLAGMSKGRTHISGATCRTPGLALDYLETKVHEVDPEFEPSPGCSARLADERRRWR